VLVSEGLVLALRDGYPVSRGHSLIVPRRHVGSFGEVSLDEQGAMLAMLQRVRAMLDAELRPDGYNIGINDGAAAGQTVMHVHMHVIPRYRGDRPDPRGGIRWIIPEKADYWSGRGE
jgi:diadenosine tetraphosphate (Ap4A) HIT family hydrolase